MAIDYPKWIYHRTHGAKLVPDPAAHALAGAEWAETPFPQGSVQLKDLPPSHGIPVGSFHLRFTESTNPVSGRPLITQIVQTPTGRELIFVEHEE